MGRPIPGRTRGSREGRRCFPLPVPTTGPRRARIPDPRRGPTRVPRLAPARVPRGAARPVMIPGPSQEPTRDLGHAGMVPGRFPVLTPVAGVIPGPCPAPAPGLVRMSPGPVRVALTGMGPVRTPVPRPVLTRGPRLVLIRAPPKAGAAGGRTSGSAPGPIRALAGRSNLPGASPAHGPGRPAIRPLAGLAGRPTCRQTPGVAAGPDRGPAGPRLAAPAGPMPGSGRVLTRVVTRARNIGTIGVRRRTGRLPRGRVPVMTPGPLAVTLPSPDCAPVPGLTCRRPRPSTAPALGPSRRGHRRRRPGDPAAITRLPVPAAKPIPGTAAARAGAPRPGMRGAQAGAPGSMRHPAPAGRPAPAVSSRPRPAAPAGGGVPGGPGAPAAASAGPGSLSGALPARRSLWSWRLPCCSSAPPVPGIP